MVWKGDTGNPAVLVSSKVEYQVSSSGTVPPSGEWSEAIPAVQQGSYLWTRTTKLFNSGAPVVDYTVGYIGRDGTVSFEELTEEQKDEIRGGVYTPEVTQPDASTMRMEFTPSQPGMPPVAPVDVTLPKGEDYILTDADRAEIATLAQKNVPTPLAPGDAASKQYADSRMVRNLLDNSDFRNPVNQRNGNYSALNWSYFIDRWIIASVGGGTVLCDISSIPGVIGFGTSDKSDIFLVQRFEKNEIDAEKVYTYAYQTYEGNVFASLASFGNDDPSVSQLSIEIPSGTYLKWAALYEGEYTAETLPPYVPKGYAAELAACQRYYYKLSRIGHIGTAFSGGYGNHYGVIQVPVSMRIKPTVSGSVMIYDDGTERKSSSIDTSGFNDNAVTIHIITDSHSANGTFAQMYLDGSVAIEISADL